VGTQVYGETLEGTFLGILERRYSQPDSFPDFALQRLAGVADVNGEDKYAPGHLPHQTGHPTHSPCDGVLTRFHGMRAPRCGGDPFEVIAVIA
jgi:hypothetical protein